MSTEVRMISPAQIKKIHAIKRELDMSERAYRQRLGRVGVKSCKEMSFELAKRFIRDLEDTKARRNGHQRLRRSYGPRITDKQISMVCAMWAEITRIDASEDRIAGLNHLVERLYHVSALHWLPIRLVSKLVETLKAMKADKLAKLQMEQAEQAIASSAETTQDAAPAETAAGI